MAAFEPAGRPVAGARASAHTLPKPRPVPTPALQAALPRPKPGRVGRAVLAPRAHRPAPDTAEENTRVAFDIARRGDFDHLLPQIGDMLSSDRDQALPLLGDLVSEVAERDPNLAESLAGAIRNLDSETKGNAEAPAPAAAVRSVRNRATDAPTVTGTRSPHADEPNALNPKSAATLIDTASVIAAAGPPASPAAPTQETWSGAPYSPQRVAEINGLLDALDRLESGNKQELAARVRAELGHAPDLASELVEEILRPMDAPYPGLADRRRARARFHGRIADMRRRLAAGRDLSDQLDEDRPRFAGFERTHELTITQSKNGMFGIARRGDGTPVLYLPRSLLRAVANGDAAMQKRIPYLADLLGGRLTDDEARRGAEALFVAPDWMAEAVPHLGTTKSIPVAETVNAIRAGLAEGLDPHLVFAGTMGRLFPEATEDWRFYVNVAADLFPVIGNYRSALEVKKDRAALVEAIEAGDVGGVVTNGLFLALDVAGAVPAAGLIARGIRVGLGRALLRLPAFQKKAAARQIRRAIARAGDPVPSIAGNVLERIERRHGELEGYDRGRIVRALNRISGQATEDLHWENLKTLGLTRNASRQTKIGKNGNIKKGHVVGDIILDGTSDVEAFLAARVPELRPANGMLYVEVKSGGSDLTTNQKNARKVIEGKDGKDVMLDHRTGSPVVAMVMLREDIRNVPRDLLFSSADRVLDSGKKQLPPKLKKIVLEELMNEIDAIARRQTVISFTVGEFLTAVIRLQLVLRDDDGG